MEGSQYVKPRFDYWSAERLNKIEAKMSGGGSGGSVSIFRKQHVADYVEHYDSFADLTACAGMAVGLYNAAWLPDTKEIRYTLACAVTGAARWGESGSQLGIGGISGAGLYISKSVNPQTMTVVWGAASCECGSSPRSVGVTPSGVLLRLLSLALGRAIPGYGLAMSVFESVELLYSLLGGSDSEYRQVWYWDDSANQAMGYYTVNVIIGVGCTASVDVDGLVVCPQMVSTDAISSKKIRVTFSVPETATSAVSAYNYVYFDDASVNLLSEECSSDRSVVHERMLEFYERYPSASVSSDWPGRHAEALGLLGSGDMR